MGFFSSRKAEDNDNLTNTAEPSDKSVVHVIRSRFYGKNKGKEREEQPPASFAPHGTSTAQTLSNSTSSVLHIPSTSSSLIRHGGSIKRAGPSILRDNNDRPSVSKLSTPARSTYAVSMAPPPSPSPSSRSRPGASTHQKTSSVGSTTPRRPTDVVTVTLAQRLNELAVANSEGLLNDEEYRLLRQNLFERFSSNAVVPTETPVVPVARPRPRVGPNPEGGPTSRPLSNFHVDVNRSPSVRSKTSVASGVANFLRRATSRRASSASRDYSETSSIFSTTSTTSNIFKLSKKSSNSSVRTTTSRIQVDAMSISSRHTGTAPDRTHSEPSSHYSPYISRSNASIRRLATPPSSFPTRTAGSDTKYGNVSDIFDEEHLKTTAEIRQEIIAVEAEARRLMDAFSGLEVTTLARVQRRQGRPTMDNGENGNQRSSTWSKAPEGRPQRRIVIAENDMVSIRSGTSGVSVSRSAYSARKTVRPRGNLNASSSMSTSSLRRKDSASSIGSQERKTSHNGTAAPPVPALPTTYGHLGVAIGSNASLTRSTSYSGMKSVPEDENIFMNEEGQIENEMEDIRRRREEVSLRYEARLEYLRAKLKGAQLHEKLLKK